MNLITGIVLMIIGVLLFFVIRAMIKSKKQGKCLGCTACKCQNGKCCKFNEKATIEKIK